MSELRIIPIVGVPEISAGDDLAALLVEAAGNDHLRAKDVLVVAHKVVSKAESRIAESKDLHRIALEESVRVLRRSGQMIISETRHGFVCANAGVDASNIDGDRVVLLPLDPDLSARRIAARIKSITGLDVGVIVSDTFGRAWRVGQTNVAIGIAGIEPFSDYRGHLDASGKLLTATRIAIADELAGAAEIVMGKSRHICAAVVRGAPVTFGRGSATQIARPPSEDLFR